MHIGHLHNRVIRDARAVHHAIDHLMPVEMPASYREKRVNVQSLVSRLNRHTESLHVWNDVVAASAEMVSDREIPAGQNRIHFLGEWLPLRYVSAETHGADVLIHWIVARGARRIQFTPSTWRAYRFTFWTYLMHELVHRHQGAMGPTHRESRVYDPRTDDFELLKERTYLGDYDEIEAHAHDVALEMIAWYPGRAFRAALREMRDEHFPRNSYATYPIYLRAFSDPTHPAFRTFQTKIHAWFTVMSKKRDVYAAMDLCPRE